MAVERLGQQFSIENRPGGGTISRLKRRQWQPRTAIRFSHMAGNAWNGVLNAISVSTLSDIAPVANIVRYTFGVRWLLTLIPAQQQSRFHRLCKLNPNKITMALAELELLDTSMASCLDDRGVGCVLVHYRATRACDYRRARRRFKSTRWFGGSDRAHQGRQAARACVTRPRMRIAALAGRADSWGIRASIF